MDAVLHRLYRTLLEQGQSQGGTRGANLEILGVSLRISKPRARISRSENRGKPFSALGELLWYLSGSDTLDFIAPYVPRYAEDAVGGLLEGAYGPRLTRMRDGIDQFGSIENLLKQRPGSRRAVIQIFNAEDIATHHKEIPCTTTLQFHMRGDLLHMSATMRSNDAYFGLPHDVFCFTMIQEMMARRLGVEIGEYMQYVGSMHVYNKKLDDMRAYVEEGVQQTIEMPPMPTGNPFSLIAKLLDVESRLRAGEALDASKEMGDQYWADIVRFLQVFWAREWEVDYPGRLKELRAELFTKTLRPYVDGRMHLTAKRRKTAGIGEIIATNG
ncbi:thymidylate synthase [Methylobacterium sp. Leaf123]|uniref:thymidylate synthase n=1 Tax=Methylobacterium sp. Leaf123 TaxID=1736264 RepID=UPI0025709A13|nr:thymidylate synthase [Methylobacterium sp. Leaf123]